MAENILPDLVTNHAQDTVEAVNTGEELEIDDALLSLGEVRDDTIDDDDNAQLMPVGAPTSIADVVPLPVLLDQINVDNAIASMIEADKLDKTKSNIPVPVPGDEDNGLTKAATTDEPVVTSTELPNTETDQRVCLPPRDL